LRHYCGEFPAASATAATGSATAALYISRTATARDYAVLLGMPRERTRVRGHLMQPRQHTEILSPAVRTEFIERTLELRSDLFTVFLATGGNAPTTTSNSSAPPALCRPRAGR